MTQPVSVTPDVAVEEPFVEPWAPWHLRVAATLVDTGLQLPFTVVSLILNTIALDPTINIAVRLGCALAALATSLVGLGFSFWNGVVRQGRCGASLGKQCFGLLVLSLDDARPIGGLRTFLRNWAHLLDVLSLGIGYLWPLWDERRQTFADKAMRTAVLQLPDVRF